MENNYSLADLRAAMGDEGGLFGGGGLGLLFIVILFLISGGLMGGGGLFGKNNSNAVTEADLCSANSFSELKGNTARISDQISGMYTGLQNGLSNFGYETLRNFNSLGQQMADYCCTTQRAIDGVKFDMANYAAATNANTTAAMQKILDKICEGEKAQMAARIQQLELQQAVCGVVRYPQAATYAVNPIFTPAFNPCSCNV